MKLEEYLDKVEDEISFLDFVRALQVDKEDEQRKENDNPSNPYNHGWNGWENSTIEGFLESAVAWAQDSDFGRAIEPNANQWKRFALFLYGGKIYE